MTMKPSEIFQVLMREVDCWNLPSDKVPSELLLIGEDAFPVLVNKKGQVLIAASQYGKGRLVVMGHEGYLQHAGLSQFLHNAVDWLNCCPGAPIGVHSSVKGLADILCNPCVEVKITDNVTECVGVYCIDAYDHKMAKELIRFVKNGGGLLIGGQAWHWSSQHCGCKVISDFPGNHTACVSGVYFTNEYGDISCLSEVSKEIPTIPLLVRFGEDLSEEQKKLLDGISEENFCVNVDTCHILVHGALAFPLAQVKSLDCFVAAARFGLGRVVVVADENMVLNPQMAPFLCNAVRWLAGEHKCKVGINPDVKDLFPLLDETGLERCIIPHVTHCLSVYCCLADKDHEAKKLREFVAEGGGLLIAGNAFKWDSENSCKIPLVDYPGNKFLNHFGLGILGETLTEHCLCASPEDRKYHLRVALAQYLSPQGGCLSDTWGAKLKRDCNEFQKMPPKGIPAYVSLQEFCSKFADK
ncbi:TRPM8 channel-associated factor 2-like [Dromiciops gliroides]|uniref:TRPM8 channel-associated factor 2-like n=1 Tax=Dromiciops gliroides TaxID=33562 RepID=UPI001CC82F91|nr:TRPM8 channel-associated factor 2-like [Dromiciops gliroides]